MRDSSAAASAARLPKVSEQIAAHVASCASCRGQRFTMARPICLRRRIPCHGVREPTVEVVLRELEPGRIRPQKTARLSSPPRRRKRSRRRGNGPGASGSSTRQAAMARRGSCSRGCSSSRLVEAQTVVCGRVISRGLATESSDEMHLAEEAIDEKTGEPGASDECHVSLRFAAARLRGDLRRRGVGRSGGWH